MKLHVTQEDFEFQLLYFVFGASLLGQRLQCLLIITLMNFSSGKIGIDLRAAIFLSSENRISKQCKSLGVVMKVEVGDHKVPLDQVSIPLEMYNTAPATPQRNTFLRDLVVGCSSR